MARGRARRRRAGRPSIAPPHNIPRPEALAMTSATAAMLGSASFQRAPSCRQDQPEPPTRKPRRANCDEQDRRRHRSCSHCCPRSPQLGGCTFRGIVMRIARSAGGECCPGCVAEGRGLNPPSARATSSSCGCAAVWGRTGTADLKLELDQRERRTIGHCLLARRSRLIETIGDTTRTAASRRIGSRELELIESVLRKLRLFDHTHHQPRIDAD